MTSNNSQWQQLRSDYITGAEKALSKIRHPKKKEVLADVASHLDQKFTELSETDKTWESFQRIITEMGPAQDYAELLEEHTYKLNKSKLPAKVIGIAAIATFTAIFTPYALLIYSHFFSERIEDNIDLPFEEDKKVYGKWQSVDFVRNINDFSPDQKQWKHDLYLKEITFHKNGKTSGPWSWSKGTLIHPNDKTASKYFIKESNDSKYMFFEWKSGDYTIHRQKPYFYVLKKQAQIQISPSKTLK